MKTILARLGIAILATLGTTPALATNYTYNGPSGTSTWSTGTNWNPVAPLGGPTSGDTAVLGNAASNTTVIYDSNASGSLGTLTFNTQTSAAVNELDVQKNLQIGTTSAATVTLGATGSGTAELLVDSYAPNLLTPTANSTLVLTIGGGTVATAGTVTVNSGGLLEMQGGTATGSGAGNVTLNANVALSGGTFNSDASSLGGNVSNTVGGNFVMTSGTLNLDATPTGAYSGTIASRQILAVSGNFQVSGGTVTDVNFPGNMAAGTSTISIAGATNFYYLTTAAPLISSFSLTEAATGTQTFYSNQQVGAVTFAGNVAGTASNNIRSLGAALFTGSATPVSANSSGTLFAGTIKLSDTTGGAVTTLQLASNVTQTAGVFQPTFAGATTSTTFAVDTNGHTLDLTLDATSSGNNLGIFSPTNTTVNGANAVHSTINLNDSATGGGIKALAFDLTGGVTTNVGNDVILNAAGTGTATLANNLGTAGSGTISPTSTFLYTGGAAGTLTSNRAIGRLAVGNGSTASTLNLATADLTVGADVTVNASGILNLGGFNLTESAVSGGTSGGLSGSGTVLNNITTGLTKTLALNTTNGTGNFSGVIEDKTGTNTGKVSLSLTNASGSNIQILSGADIYTGGTTINSGTLMAESHTALGSGAVTVATGAALDYQATTDTTLALTSTLGVTGGTGTTIGGSIGASTASSKIAVTGAMTTSGAVKVNIFGESGSATTSGTGAYTLLSAGSGVSGATYTLGFVYNNTNFILTNPGAPFSTSGTALNVGITTATALTNAYWVGGGTGLSGANTVWAASNGSTTSNWTATSGSTTTQALVPGSGTTVNIATTTSTAATGLTLGANMSIAGLNITNTGGLGLNADGNTLTIGTGGITMNSGVGASSIAAGIALGGNQNWSDNSVNALSVGGVVSGTGNLTLTGTGTVILSGNNIFTGTTTISAGKLRLASLNAGQNTVISIGATNDLNFAGGTTFNIGGLSGSANEALVDTSNNGINLTVGNGNNSASYGGILSGAGSLTKVGSGTQTLTNTNTYTGLLSLNGGVLNATAGAINATNTANGIAFNGGTLAASGTINTAKPITLLGTGTIDTTGGNVTLSGNILGSGGTLTKAGTGTMTVSGSTNNFASLTINDGTVVDGTSSVTALDTSAGITNFASTGGTPILDLNGNSPTIGLLNSTNSSIGVVVVGSNAQVINSGTTMSTLTLSGASSRNYGGTISGNIALNVFATQSTNAGQQFSNTNTYTGGTTISTAGFGNSLLSLIGTGSLGSGPVTLNSTSIDPTAAILTLSTTSDLTIGSLNGVVGTPSSGVDTATINTQTGHALTINQTTAGTYAGTIAGGGSVTLGSSSTAPLTMTNANTYTGGTTVSGGTFYANNASGTPTYADPTTDGRTITSATSASATGTGAVTVQNGGTLAGNGTINPTGVTTSTTGSGAVTVQSGGTLSSGSAQVATSTSTSASGPGLTLVNNANTSSSNPVLAVNAGATLTFALGTDGTNTGLLAFATPNTNSTYMTVAGNANGEINFTNTTLGSGQVLIDLVDLTTNATLPTTHLSLRDQNPYLLIQSGSNSNYDLITSLNGVLSVNGNGYVVGVGTSTSSYNSDAFAYEITATGSPTNLQTPSNYEGLQLYLYNGDLEIVPEPGTWALMLGGLAMLMMIQRRRNKS